MHAEKTADNRPMTPSQNYKSSHRGFSLAELTAAAVIMVGIWLGALAYMNAASEEFDEAKEETLAQAPEEDIAILTEIRAAESALVAAEAVTEEARRAAEAARERAAAREREAARRAAEAPREQAYRQLLRELIDIIDTTPAGSATRDALLQHKDITRVELRWGYRMKWNYETSKKWPTKTSDLVRLCKEAVRGKSGWVCTPFSTQETWSGGRTYYSGVRIDPRE